MKLTVAGEELNRALSSARNIISSRTTLPVLSHVLLQASDGWLKLSATDLDVTISASAKATVKEPGSVTVNAGVFCGIINGRKLDIAIEADEKNSVCKVNFGSSHYELEGLSSDEFPMSPMVKGETKSFSVLQSALKRMLARTSFAQSSDESRYVLCGTCFIVKEQELRLVATDSRRIAMVDDGATCAKEQAGQFIVPKKTVDELDRLLLDDGWVEITYREKDMFWVEFKDERGLTLVSKLIEGNYPEYEQVIPKENKHRIALVREPFLATLKRAQKMTSEKSNSVKLTLSNNKLEVSSGAPGVGKCRENIAIAYKGEDFKIAFSPGYLIDALSALDTDEVFLGLSELQPGVLKINGAFVCAIMPMRLQ